MIKISLKGLAKFMVGTSTQQRKILRDFKYPDPEGTAQAVYYREARDIIEAFHGTGNDLAWLNEQAALLKNYASMASERSASRLTNNARALKMYGQHFGKRNFEILPPFKSRLEIEGVIISIYPDLHVYEGISERIIKLEFGKDLLGPLIPKIICQAMNEATKLKGNTLKGNCINCFEVVTGTMYNSSPSTSRLMRNIEDACRNICAIWSTLK